jgi:hypothetical protein
MARRDNALQHRPQTLLMVACVCFAATGNAATAWAADRRVRVTVSVAVPADHCATFASCGNSVVFSHPWNPSPGDSAHYPDLPGGQVTSKWFADTISNGPNQKWICRLRNTPHEDNRRYLAVDWATKRLHLTSDAAKAALWTIEWRGGDGRVPTIVHNGERHVIDVDPESVKRYENPRVCTYDAVVTSDKNKTGIVFYLGSK